MNQPHINLYTLFLGFPSPSGCHRALPLSSSNLFSFLPASTQGWAKWPTMVGVHMDTQLVNRPGGWGSSHINCCALGSQTIPAQGLVEQVVEKSCKAHDLGKGKRRFTGKQRDEFWWAEETKATTFESKGKIKIKRANFFWQQWSCLLRSKVSLNLWNQPAWKVFLREIIAVLVITAPTMTMRYWQQLTYYVPNILPTKYFTCILLLSPHNSSVG